MSNEAARIAALERRILQLERLTPPHVTAASSAAAVATEASARAGADAALDGRLDVVEPALTAIEGDVATLSGDLTTLEATVAAISVPPLSSATPATVSAAAGAAGVSSNTSRADHAHQVSVGTPGAATVGASAAAGSAATLARSDHAHSFATGTPVAVAPDGAASAGSGGAFAHSNHQHGLATYASTPAAVSSATGSAGTSGAAPARGDHSHALTPADGSTPGGVSLSAQKLGAGEKSADSFKGTSANTAYALGGGSPAAQVLRAESTSSIGQAVLDFYVNGARKGLIRGDYAGNITADVLTAFYVLVNGASIHQADSAGLRPGSDNSLTCGRSGARWSAVWAATGTIQTSDAADKVDVEDTPLGLDFVLQLKPRSWRWRVGQRELVQVGTRIETIEVDGKQEHHEVAVWEEREVPGRRRHHGFVVQEVVAALEARGVPTEDFAAVVDPSVADAEDASAKGLRYDQLIAPLTRAVQELSQKLDAALQRIADLEQDLADKLAAYEASRMAVTSAKK